MRRPGKRVGGYLYVHRDAIPLLGDDERGRVEAAATAVGDRPWNVAKIGRGGAVLLLYEDFDREPFPALLRSMRPGGNGAPPEVTGYAARGNPPILHRKELLLPPGDPRIPAFAALTAAAEGHGLFRETRSIGTRERWRRRIEEAGLELRGHELVRRNGAAQGAASARHRTAIVRRELSQPVALMIRLGMLEDGGEVMDYGCGLGDDVAALSAAGYGAFGWDPYHRPDGPRREADLVNLGFVLNVIEDPAERLEVLRDAWSFARRALVVAVMPLGKSDVSGHRPFGDGFLTSWRTFQRYFTQDDLRALTAEATGEHPVSLSSGIVALFRDKELEQEVAYRRRSRSVLMARDAATRPRPPRLPTGMRPARPGLRERLVQEVAQVRQKIVELGRAPAPDELPTRTRRTLAAKRVSPARAVALCMEEAADEVVVASAARREDLLVHFALTLFPGAPRYQSLPASIRRDVRAFFGSHAAMMAEATALLYSAGDAAQVRAAIEAAAASGAAGRLGAGLAFLPGELPRLPRTLRVLIGCAEVLLEDAVDADFALLLPDGPTLSLMRTAAPESPFPRIIEDVRVDLARQRVRRLSNGSRLLYLKAQYMPSGAQGRDKQVEYDARLLAAGIVTEDAVGPSANELNRILFLSQSVPK